MPKSKKCFSLETIVACADNELSMQRTLRVKAHIAACDRCAKEYKRITTEIRAIKEALSTEHAAPFVKETVREVKKRAIERN